MKSFSEKFEGRSSEGCFALGQGASTRPVLAKTLKFETVRAYPCMGPLVSPANFYKRTQFEKSRELGSATQIFSEF